MARGVVALSPHALDVEVWAPALECSGAVFQAADCVVSIEEGAVGEAFRGVDTFADAVVDDRWRIFVDAWA